MLNEQQKQLIEENIPLVYHIIDRYFKQNFYYIEREELINEGLYWLCKCASKYDSSRGVKFSTFAYRCVKRHLKDYLINFYDKRIETVEIDTYKDVPVYDDYKIDTSEEMKEFLLKYLKEKQAKMVIDYYFNNLSWEEVAQKYGYANRKAACAVCQKELKKISNNNYLKNKMIELFT